MAFDETGALSSGGIIGLVFAVAGFLWRRICVVDGRSENLVGALKKHHEIVHQEIWTAINENNRLIHEKTADAERRYSTRDEVMKILEHMDRSSAETNNRLDQLIQTLLNGRH